VKHAYLYYRIDPAQEAMAADRIDALLGEMAGHCARPPRRFCRCDDPVVWMEVYEGIADYAAFSAALDAAVYGFGCAGFIQGERHLECFTPPPRGFSGTDAPAR
jgi:hypothetical protein